MSLALKERAGAFRIDSYAAIFKNGRDGVLRALVKGAMGSWFLGKSGIFDKGLDFGAMLRKIKPRLVFPIARI